MSMERWGYDNQLGAHPVEAPSLGNIATEWLPHLVGIALVKAFPAAGQEPLELRHYRLLFVQQGKAVFIVSGRQVVLRSPGIYVMAPGMKIESVRQPQEPLEAYQLDFQIYQRSSTKASEGTERLIYEQADNLPVHGLINWRIDALKRLLLQLYAHRSEQHTASEQLKTGQRLLKLLELLLPLPLERPHEDTAEDRMNAAIRYAAEHCHEEVKVEQLSELAGLQLSSFSRRFRQMMDKSPTEFIVQRRMNRAKEQLITGGWRNMREVAQSSGFHDEFYFSRRFKRLHGISPSRYRLEVTRDTSIISLSYPYTEQLLALGIIPRAAQVPVALQGTLPVLPLPYHEKDPWEISRNMFVDCAPELIVCKDNVLRQARLHIGDVAPIISYPWRAYDLFGLQQQLARVLGRELQAEQWQEQYRLQELQAREALPVEQRGATLAICVLHSRGWRLYGARNIGHVFYRALGFQPPEQVQRALEQHPPGVEFTWMELDVERLDNVKADYLAFVVQSEQGEMEVRRRLQHSLSWRRHPAIVQRRYAVLDWHRWMVYAPLSVQWQLQQAVTLFDESLYPVIDPLLP